jgi:hypothetical protein
MATVKADAIDGLKKQVDDVTSNPDGAAGIVYCAVNKKGDLVFEHASGKVGKGSDKPMTMDTVFWIASCTKMITGIACMQLVEQGKLSLDDTAIVEKLAPVSLVIHGYWGFVLNRDVGVEGCPSYRWREACTEEEGDYAQDVAFSYGLVERHLTGGHQLMFFSRFRIFLLRFSTE